MITTAELQTTILTLESAGEPQETILIVGSCRCVAFINYLNRYNESAGKPFRIHAIEPFTFSEAQREQMETDERVLGIIRATTIFIHEHYGNFGMFNTSRTIKEAFATAKNGDEFFIPAGVYDTSNEIPVKNIYQFGMAPRLDISIPNFHDVMVLENDYAAYGQPTPENYVELGEAAVKKFCNLCLLTSFPEMFLHFWQNWRTTRFFYRPNHTSSAFTLYIFKLMEEKFLKLGLTDDFWQGASTEDLFRDPHTEVTENDRKAYGITW